MLTAIRNIPRTFYSRSYYADLILRGKGIGIGLMLVVLFFNYAAPLLSRLPELPATKQTIVEILSHFPDITIKDNTLSMEQPSPYTVAVPDGKKPAMSIVFDTAESANDKNTLSERMDKDNIDILATGKFVAVRKDKKGSGIEIHDYSKFSGEETLAVTHEDWISLGETIGAVLPYVMAFTLIPIFVFVLIGSFIKGIVVLIAGQFFTNKPSLAASMRLAVAATVPPSVLGFILYVAKTHSGLEMTDHTSIMGVVLWAILIVFGLVCASKESKPQT